MKTILDQYLYLTIVKVQGLRRHLLYPEDCTYTSHAQNKFLRVCYTLAI